MPPKAIKISDATVNVAVIPSSPTVLARSTDSALIPIMVVKLAKENEDGKLVREEKAVEVCGKAIASTPEEYTGVVDSLRRIVTVPLDNFI